MAEDFTSFCWVKVAPVAGHATVSNKPPAYAVGRPLPPGVTEQTDEHGDTVLVADAGLYGRWATHVDNTGVPGIGLTYSLMHVIGGQEVARQWMSLAEGQDWIRGSIDHFLVVFERPVATLAAVRSTASLVRTDCRYGAKNWGQQYLAFLEKPAGLLLPDDCADRAKLPPPNPFVDECDVVVAMTSLQANRRHEILETAEGRNAVLPVQQVLRNLSPQREFPKLELMVGILLENVRYPLFQLKQRFDRGRPKSCCDGVTAMFEHSDLDPTHPSYPAGHATYAHSLSKVLGGLFPNLADAFNAGARRSAENRVVAGLHYPSDNVAGEKLAEALVGMLKENATFSALLDEVYEEWRNVAA